VGQEQFSICQAKKLLWAAIFWVLCHGLGEKSVGHVAELHREEVRRLVAELLPVALHLFAPESEGEPTADGSAPGPNAEGLVGPVTDKLCEYSLSIGAAVPDKGMALEEFEWRNGPLLRAAATPLHVEWLKRASCPRSLIEAFAAGQ